VAVVERAPDVIVEGVFGRVDAVGEVRVLVQPANVSKLTQTTTARFITIES
jgi:hypothetical protein